MTGWCPARLFFRDGKLRVDWRYVGGLRFNRGPFFHNAIETAMELPFCAMFWRETAADVLIDWAKRSPGAPPRGFIHHMSRCGSTLISGMLGACDANISLAEPSPMDVILRGPFSEEDRLELARAWLSACAQPHHGERTAFVKFDSRHVREVPFLRQAFPGVPWIFLYREPLEVVVSHVRHPAPWGVKGMLDATFIGLYAQEAHALSAEDYLGKALGTILEWAVQYAGDPEGMLVEYSELPAAFTGRILPHFGVDYSSEEISSMQAASARNAKEPDVLFQPDGERKQKAVKPWMREITDRWIRPHYEKLEQLRRAAQE